MRAAKVVSGRGTKIIPFGSSRVLMRRNPLIDRDANYTSLVFVSGSTPVVKETEHSGHLGASSRCLKGAAFDVTSVIPRRLRPNRRCRYQQRECGKKSDLPKKSKSHSATLIVGCSTTMADSPSLRFSQKRLDFFRQTEIYFASLEIERRDL